MLALISFKSSFLTLVLSFHVYMLLNFIIINGMFIDLFKHLAVPILFPEYFHLEYSLSLLYQSESEVLQYVGNIRHLPRS